MGAAVVLVFLVRTLVVRAQIRTLRTRLDVLARHLEAEERAELRMEQAARRRNNRLLRGGAALAPLAMFVIATASTVLAVIGGDTGDSALRASPTVTGPEPSEAVSASPPAREAEAVPAAPPMMPAIEAPQGTGASDGPVRQPPEGGPSLPTTSSSTTTTTLVETPTVTVSVDEVPVETTTTTTAPEVDLPEPVDLDPVTGVVTGVVS